MSFDNFLGRNYKYILGALVIVSILTLSEIFIEYDFNVSDYKVRNFAAIGLIACLWIGYEIDSKYKDCIEDLRDRLSKGGSVTLEVDFLKDKPDKKGNE